MGSTGWPCVARPSIKWVAGIGRGIAQPSIKWVSGDWRGVAPPSIKGEGRGYTPPSINGVTACNLQEIGALPRPPLNGLQEMGAASPLSFNNGDGQDGQGGCPALTSWRALRRPHHFLGADRAVALRTY